MAARYGTLHSVLLYLDSILPSRPQHLRELAFLQKNRSVFPSPLVE